MCPSQVLPQEISHGFGPGFICHHYTIKAEQMVWKEWALNALGSVCFIEGNPIWLETESLQMHLDPTVNISMGGTQPIYAWVKVRPNR